MGDAHFLSGKKKAALFLLSLGKDTSRKVMEYLDKDSAATIMEVMKNLDAEDISMMDHVCDDIVCEIQGYDPELLSGLKDDDPETIARKLSHLPPEKASLVMRKLPERLRAEVSRKVASMDRDANSALKVKIKNRTLTFDEMNMLDDDSIRHILSEVEFMQLDKALRTASAETREKFFRNMHPHLAEELRDILEQDRTVSFMESEQAQKEILDILFMILSRK
ncbi:MAG: hypothetical protein MJ215_03520 [Spirochaetia bacterium]|nr:hypothetical protein [Spirochaetia bacterium]